MVRVAEFQTGCGVRALNRPCQADGPPTPDNQSWPRAPMCQAPGETIYIVDDDREFLEEMAECLSGLGVPVSCFDSPEAFRQSVSQPVTGCIILDLRLPEYDGTTLQAWLNTVSCVAPIIFLTGSGDVSVAVECMKAGARDFLIKPVDEAALRGAVVSALAESRRRYCRLASTTQIVAMLGQLTPAETKVADLLASGYVTKQIASMLNRSENTVKIHRARILNKLGISSGAGLAQLKTMAPDHTEPVD